MDRPRHIHIDLVQDTTGGPSGRVRADDVDEHFDGWLGLVTVLAGVVADASRSAEPADDLGGEGGP